MTTATPPAEMNPPPVADAPPGNWVDAYAPVSWRPYLRLARADRPIGTWLLLLPCWWSLSLASIANGRPYPNPWHVVLFAIGAFAMRAAGCAYNDVVDRDYDAKVARTMSRPIPSGQVSPRKALIFVAALALTGLVVLVQFNTFTVWLAIASLALVLVYPFMKRLTNWPQLVLGLAFNWGALVGWSALTQSLALPAAALYAGCVLWTLGYDTIYAHQDKEDDLMLGLKSTALHFGSATKTWVGGFYLATLLLWALACALAGAHLVTYVALVLVALHFAWQVSGLDIDDADNCLRRFRANRNVGFILFAGLLSDMAISWAAGVADQDRAGVTAAARARQNADWRGPSIPPCRANRAYPVAFVALLPGPIRLICHKLLPIHLTDSVNSQLAIVLAAYECCRTSIFRNAAT